jgi:hypothetical protein
VASVTKKGGINEVDLIIINYDYICCVLNPKKESITSGRAGGLKYVNRSKRIMGWLTTVKPPALRGRYDWFYAIQREEKTARYIY